jgi:Transcription factor WhiB
MVPPSTVLITTAEAARRLGVSRVRSLEGFRIEGRRNRYVRADLGGDVPRATGSWCPSSQPRQLGMSTVTVTRLANQARVICAECEVQGECLEFALRDPEETEFGVWGGTTPGQRRRLRGQSREPLSLVRFWSAFGPLLTPTTGDNCGQSPVVKFGL